MIRLTFVKVLCVFVVMLLVGIASFMMLLPKQEKHSDKQVGTILHVNSQKDIPKIQVSPQKDTPNLHGKTEGIELMPLKIGASDEELKAYLTKFENTEITEDMLDTTDPYFIEATKRHELIVAGKHPDYPPQPSREDFSSELDYLKADLEYYKKKVLEAEGTKYQEDFESIVSTIEKNIEREKSWIDHKERRREADSEMKSRLIEMNVDMARIMAQSDEYWVLYLEHVAPSVPTQIQEAVLEKFLKDEQPPEASGVSTLSDDPIPSVESRESVSVAPVVDPNLPIEVKQLMEQVGSWNEALIKDFLDIFAYPDAKSRDALSQKLPSEGSRQYFRERQSALHKEYATLLASQLKGLSKQKREQAIGAARQSLLQKWDADFADAVMRQLQQAK